MDGGDDAVGPGRAAGVEWMVCVGTDLETSEAALVLADRHDDVFAAVGLHPHDASKLAVEWSLLEPLAVSDGASRSASAGSTSSTSTRRGRAGDRVPLPDPPGEGPGNRS